MNVKGGASVGDTVRIVNDEDKVKNLQDGHGGYNKNMKHYLGKVGQIIKIDSDGDVYVKFGRRWFMYNPKCCLPAPGETVYEGSGDEDDDSMNGRSNLPDFNNVLLNMLKASGLAEGMSQSVSAAPILFVAIRQRDFSRVRKILADNPGSVNTIYNGMTPLVFASNHGYRDIVEELLNKGADIDKVDKDGDTPLLASIAGKEPVIGKLLIERGSDVNIVNNTGRTALHYAAICDYSSLVELIINKGCDVNLQDSEGDTALHDAILAGSKESIAVLCKATNLNLGIVNKRAFNTLQFACFKGHPIAVDTILDLDKSLVHVKTPDGFTALHIAAVNDRTDCAKLLIEKGNADVNSRNLDGVRPLMLAALEGCLECVQFLIEKNANVNAVDGKKNSPLHLCCLERNSGNSLLAAMIGLSGSSNTENRIKVAKYLIEKGAKTDLKNADGKTPLDCCTDVNMKRVFSNQAGGSTGSSGSGGTRTVPNWEGLPCRECIIKTASITLMPCGHKCVCRNCALQVNKCPICQQFIDQRVDFGGSPREDLECCVQ